MINGIAIMCMQNRPFGNGLRQIKRHAATKRLIDIHCRDAASVIISNIIGDQHIMTFSGHPHILVTIINQFGGAPGFPYRQCRHNRGQIALAFFAAKAAAHAPNINRHGMKRNAQSMRNFMLNFGRVLARYRYGNIARLPRHGISGLSF